jgi:hypothetical protein
VASPKTSSPPPSLDGRGRKALGSLSCLKKPTFMSHKLPSTAADRVHRLSLHHVCTHPGASCFVKHHCKAHEEQTSQAYMLTSREFMMTYI